MKSSTSNCLKHLHSADGQVVGAALNVLVLPSKDGGFVAQGIEIDYTASGSTEEAAREHFAQGFCSTIVSYLARGRAFDGLFKTSTPREYVQAYYSGKFRQVFACTVTECKPDVVFPEGLPVPERINFMQVEVLTA